MIDETSLPMTEIAMQAGFGSLRRFNSVFAEVYGRPPTNIRRTRRPARPRSGLAENHPLRKFELQYFPRD